MTNKEDEPGDGKPPVVAMVAVQLVSQVLDEAYAIAQAVQDSGEPWKYTNMIKNIRKVQRFRTDVPEVSFTISKENVEEDDKEIVIATSTPEKKSVNKNKEIKDIAYVGIGEGDEKSNIEKSTSMYINHLFDLSEVENATPYAAKEAPVLNSGEKTPILNFTETESVSEIMNSCIDKALNMAMSKENVTQESENICETEITSSKGSDYSTYSFLNEAKYIGKEGQESAICIDNEDFMKNDTGKSTSKKFEIKENASKERNEIASYDEVFLTLNRDDEQFSEDGVSILPDLQGVSLQEVELLDEHAMYVDKIEPSKQAQQVEILSSTTDTKRKNTLMRHCRNKSTRIFACIRNWCRRKTANKSKMSRIPSDMAFCPLSPDARQRAASLLEQRFHSPSPGRRCAWKYNTVNECLVNSERWRDYEVYPEDTVDVLESST